MKSGTAPARLSTESRPQERQGVVMIVTEKSERRFERRWVDYYQVLEEGTSRSVGRRAPPPPDRPKAVMAALGPSTPKRWEAADAELDAVWASDRPAWPR